MNRFRLFITAISVMLVACQAMNDKNTIAELRHKQIEIKEEKIEGGIEKAMQSYQRFLEETPGSALAPEAIRRLADLKIEKEYGTLTEAAWRPLAPALPSTESAERPAGNSATAKSSHRALAHIAVHDESEADFERRAIQRQQVESMAVGSEDNAVGADDLERPSAREAIELYKKLLNEYPLYKRNDQVLYQMSRAYEELGQTKAAMGIMDRMVRDFPRSRYIDEVQFRRAEYFFAHRRYLDAEDAYKSIVGIGVSSSYYELALYKLGWTFYKQEIYEDALDRFIALLDHKVSVGYDFEQTEDEQERKRMEDTFRVVSLGFSNLGGADSVAEYFLLHGKRSYEDNIYSNLGEFYFDKRRYADAAATYDAFVNRNRFHKVAPNFHMRVIEIHAAGGFPSLVLESKKQFATTYGLNAEYWKHFEPSERPDVLDHLKTNLTDLANHYHACYQDPRQAKEKSASFKEALHWYREFLISFPMDAESPAINYQLADLLLENRSFGAAAVEYEKIAYEYPPHARSSEAGYSAVYAYRKHLDTVVSEDRNTIRREVVRSSLKFADTFPKHEKAAIVLGSAADDLYGMKEYEQALVAAKRLLKAFPDIDGDVARSAWLVVGHSSYELLHYSEAETAYLHVLELLPAGDKTRDGLVDNLAASIYKQGEQANAVGDYRVAADHFLRVGRMAPTSKIRPNAEYDAAAALIQLKDWDTASTVLVGFRNGFPGHPLQPEVTKKIAYVYRENGQLSLAANEYERIERESEDVEIRREALLVAAELHEEDGKSLRALEVYRRYVSYFPQPVELNIETRNKIAGILKSQNDQKSYLNELKEIVAIDASAGSARTPRTRYLAAQAALVLAESKYDAFVAVRLVKPFEVHLRQKRDLMKEATQEFSRLMDYEFGEITAAATFYLAEIYAHFSNALMESERPEGLSPLEREKYELAIEEQAYPFEEKAINVHESNLKLISRGVYNIWIEKSLQRLAEFVPARYDKPEETSGIVSSLETYIFEIPGPMPQVSEFGESEQTEAPGSATESESVEPAQAEESSSTKESESAELEQAEESGSGAESESVEPAPAEEPASETESESAEPEQAQESGSVTESESVEPAPAEEPASETESESAELEQAEESGSATEPESVEPAQAEESSSAKEPASVELEQAQESGFGTESETVEPEQAEEPPSETESESAKLEQAEESGSGAECESVKPAQAEESSSAAESGRQGDE